MDRMLKVALREPLLVPPGANAIWKVQLPPGVTAEPQPLLDTVKSVALVPVKLKLLTVRLPLPVLDTVRFWDVLVVPMSCEEKLKDVGLTPIVGRPVTRE